MTDSSEPSPLILVHRPPSLGYMEEIISRNYRILQFDNSSEPLPIFLSNHAASIRAFVNMGTLRITDELLLYLPSLEIVILTCVGVDHIDLPACKRRGVVVTNAGTAFSEDTADCAVGLVISVLRGIPAADRFVRSGNWTEFGGFSLGSKVCSKSNSLISNFNKRHSVGFFEVELNAEL